MFPYTRALWAVGMLLQIRWAGREITYSATPPLTYLHVSGPGQLATPPRLGAGPDPLPGRIPQGFLENGWNLQAHGISGIGPK